MYLQYICALHFGFNVYGKILFACNEKYDSVTFSLITNPDVFNSTNLASKLIVLSLRING